LGGGNPLPLCYTPPVILIGHKAMPFASRTLAWLLPLALAAPALFASELRVMSMGGLSSVVNDETADLNLFLDGNPAGLSLLPVQNRLDLAGQWTASQTPAVSAETPGWSQQTLTTRPGTAPKVIGYHGLQLFLSPQWALQASGDLAGLRQSPAFGDGDLFNQDGSLFFARAAYNLGPLALGAETQSAQIHQAFSPGVFASGVSLSGGQSSENQWELKAGALGHFTEGADSAAAHWQGGGFFHSTLSPDQPDQTLTLYGSGQPPFKLHRLFDLQTQGFTGEIFYERPGELQARLSLDLSESKTHLTQSASAAVSQYPDFSSPLSDQKTLSVAGAAKGRWHFSDVDLKWGASLQCAGVDEKTYGSGGAPGPDLHQTQWEALAGIGLEAPEDYLVGLQLKCDFLAGGTLGPEASGDLQEAPPNQNSCQAALGGEKWISPDWALRIGVVNEIDFGRSAPFTQKLLSNVVGGVGWRGENLQVDGELTLGETFPLNDGSLPLTTQTGFALAGTFFL